MRDANEKNKILNKLISHANRCCPRGYSGFRGALLAVETHVEIAKPYVGFGLHIQTLQKHVRRLHIAVPDARRVHVAQSAAQLCADGGALVVVVLTELL